jgi:hypothetical protein
LHCDCKRTTDRTIARAICGSVGDRSSSLREVGTRRLSSSDRGKRPAVIRSSGLSPTCTMHTYARRCEMDNVGRTTQRRLLVIQHSDCETASDGSISRRVRSRVGDRCDSLREYRARSRSSSDWGKGSAVICSSGLSPRSLLSTDSCGSVDSNGRRTHQHRDFGIIDRDCK